MIPAIEAIVTGLLDGTIDRFQAVKWLHMHAKGVADEQRDWYAGQAMKSLILLCAHDDRDGQEYEDYIAEKSLKFADAMLKARQQGGAS